MKDDQRRARLAGRHLLDGSGTSAVQAAESVAVLHATDPATVYLSVLARSARLRLADVAQALYADRALVRMMAMRRTLFVIPAELVPVVHHAASLDVAATMRKRLLKDLAAGPTDPALPEDVSTWLTETEAGVEAAIGELTVASGAQLAAAEPRLRTALLPRSTKAYDVRRTITSQVLALMGCEGRLVRSRPLGSWTSRQHTWEAGWADGIPDVPDAKTRLAATYVRRFGPVTEGDVAWWTGWPLGVTRKALATQERIGDFFVAPDDLDPVEEPPPSAALLPALDPTPMGWKEREWYLPDGLHAFKGPLFDAYGNVGPTVWWGGEVIGGWAVRKDGSVVTRLLADRGAEAVRAVDEQASRLQGRLEGAVVTPSFRTPLERELSA